MPLLRLCVGALAAGTVACAALRQPLPETLPFIRGAIAQHCHPECSLGYLIVADAGGRDAFAYDSAWVHVYSDTRVAHRDGRDATAGDLRVGQRVSVWITPIVNESRPVQVVATILVIEPR